MHIYISTLVNTSSPNVCNNIFLIIIHGYPRARGYLKGSSRQDLLRWASLLFVANISVWLLLQCVLSTTVQKYFFRSIHFTITICVSFLVQELRSCRIFLYKGRNAHVSINEFLPTHCFQNRWPWGECVFVVYRKEKFVVLSTFLYYMIDCPAEIHSSSGKPAWRVFLTYAGSATTTRWQWRLALTERKIGEQNDSWWKHKLRKRSPD